MTNIKLKNLLNNMEEQKYISITRSYSHKLVPENHGIKGHRFAPLDFFASYHIDVPVDAKQEEIQTASDKMYELAKADVERAIADTIKELEATEDDGLTQDELDQVAPFIKVMTDDKVEDPVGTFKMMVANAKDDLNDKQLEWLRKYLRASM